jgi:hypothetical protein
LILVVFIECFYNRNPIDHKQCEKFYVLPNHYHLIKGGILLKSIAVFGLLLTILILMVSPVMATVDSWGVGVGIPYGAIGANLDCNIIPDVLDLSLGVGVYPWADDLAHNIGLKLYFASKEKSFRPRLSCYYGTNTYVEEPSWFSDEYTAYNGVTIGIGASVAFGRTHRHGLDFDLMYIASTKADLDDLKTRGYDTSDANDINISIGYRHFF